MAGIKNQAYLGCYLQAIFLFCLAPEPLWAFSKIRRTITVAVIDTGIDRWHPLFRGRLWENPGESGRDREGRDKQTNQVDDDGNGLVDDVHGWNFAASSSDLSDRHGHGTHIAGLIAEGTRHSATAEPSAARLMILKYFDSSRSSQDSIRASVQAIEYARSMGADIINYSAGGPAYVAEERLAIERAGYEQILFVAAAGNWHTDIDVRAFYPASYCLSNILAVAALGQNGELLSSSNFGERTVRLAAPGERLWSATPGGGLVQMSGTSQATALASAAAALVLARSPERLAPRALISHLLASVQDVSQRAPRSPAAAKFHFTKAKPSALKLLSQNKN